MAILEVEIDGPRNETLRFRPLQRSLRGRFDWSRIGEPEAHRVATQYGGLPIPGQRLGFDDDKLIGYVADPLHDTEHAAVAERIKAKGHKLPPAREEFPAQDRNTWLFWMSQAVNCKLARVVKGQLPDDIDPSRARRDFLFAPKQPGITDKLTDALNNLAAAQAAQTDVLAKLLAAISSKR